MSISTKTLARFRPFAATAIGVAALGAGASAMSLDDANSLSNQTTVNYQKTGGILGEQARLVIMDDGAVFARRSVGGQVSEGTDQLGAGELEHLRDAVVRELERPRIALWDCGLVSDEVMHILKGAVDGQPRSLTTCDPDAHLMALFARLESLIDRVLDPDINPTEAGRALTLTSSEWMVAALYRGAVERHELRVFRRTLGPPRYVLFGIDEDGMLHVAERGDLDARSLRRFRALLDHVFEGGGVIHGHDLPRLRHFKRYDGDTPENASDGPDGVPRLRFRRPAYDTPEAGTDGPDRQPRLKILGIDANGERRQRVYRTFDDPVARGFLRLLVR